MNPRKHRVIAWLGGLAMVLATCTPSPEGDLSWVQDKNFRIGNPSATRAWVTGIGCAPTKDVALNKARAVATFNLRNLTGPNRYAIEYRVLGPIARKEPGCWEIQASAIPLVGR